MYLYVLLCLKHSEHESLLLLEPVIVLVEPLSAHTKQQIRAGNRHHMTSSEQDETVSGNNKYCHGPGNSRTQ